MLAYIIYGWFYGDREPRSEMRQLPIPIEKLVIAIARRGKLNYQPGQNFVHQYEYQPGGSFWLLSTVSTINVWQYGVAMQLSTHP